MGTCKVKVKKFYSFIRVPNMPWSPFEVFTDKVIKAYRSRNHLILCLNLIELQGSYVANKLNNPNILNKKKNFVTIYTLNNSKKEKYSQSNVVLAAHDDYSAPHGPHPSLGGLCPIEKELTSIVVSLVTSRKQNTWTLVKNRSSTISKIFHVINISTLFALFPFRNFCYFLGK